MLTKQCAAACGTSVEITPDKLHTPVVCGPCKAKAADLKGWNEPVALDATYRVDEAVDEPQPTVHDYERPMEIEQDTIQKG